MLSRRNLMTAVCCCLLLFLGGLVSVRLRGAVNSAPPEDRNPAVNNPDKFAWELFTAINRPAGNGSNDALWETWALRQNVFADPNNAPIWPGTTHQPKILSQSTKIEMARQQMILRRSNQLLMQRQNADINKMKAFVPESPLKQEVRMNKANFDFIVQKNLWYLEGQIAAFNDGRPISFPPDAKEVKAQWKVIEETDKPRFHWQQGPDGKLYGLIALHVMTKDLPNWFWATWEHVDNPRRCQAIGCVDSFGIDPATGDVSQSLKDLFTTTGLGAEWQNYRLTGTQTDFVDPTGRPILLGNSEIEDFLVPTSSCITCHAKSTVSGTGSRLDFLNAEGLSDNGVPNPAWFFDISGSGSTRKFIQLDFEWSLQFAKPRTH